jgi:hypothetical protein
MNWPAGDAFIKTARLTLSAGVYEEKQWQATESSK